MRALVLVLACVLMLVAVQASYSGSRAAEAGADPSKLRKHHAHGTSEAHLSGPVSRDSHRFLSHRRIISYLQAFTVQVKQFTDIGRLTLRCKFFGYKKSKNSEKHRLLCAKLIKI